MLTALHSLHPTLPSLQQSPNVLTFRNNQQAPAPVHHDDVRDTVGKILDEAPMPAQVGRLMLSDIVTVLPRKVSSARAIWRSMRRLCAGALDGFLLKQNYQTDLTTVIAWASDEEFYQADFYQTDGASSRASNLGSDQAFDSSDFVEDVLVFVNEILDGRDAFGRLYGLPSRDGQLFVGYFTDAEVERLEAMGHAPDMF